MKHTLLFILAIYLTCFQVLTGQTESKSAIRIIWKDTAPEGNITARYGIASELQIIRGRGSVKDLQFTLGPAAVNSIHVTFVNCQLEPGSASTLVSLQTKKHPFSFFLRDVNAQFPVYIPEYDVIVTEGDDTRDFNEIQYDISSRPFMTKLELMESEREESFETAAKVTRNQTCPTWLGISRDIRTFEIYNLRG
jgi:hypothetical protein